MSNDLLTQIKDLNTLVLNGKAMDAFEKYYADDVSMQENDAAPTLGKAQNRQREIEFFGNIEEFRGAEVLSVAAAGDKTYVEWFMDYTHKQWGVKKYHQVAVQTWKNGKIVAERFYYGS